MTHGWYSMEGFFLMTSLSDFSNLHFLKMCQCQLIFKCLSAKGFNTDVTYNSTYTYRWKESGCSWVPGKKAAPRAHWRPALWPPPPPRTGRNRRAVGPSPHCNRVLDPSVNDLQMPESCKPRPGSRLQAQNPVLQGGCSTLKGWENKICLSGYHTHLWYPSAQDTSLSIYL